MKDLRETLAWIYFHFYEFRLEFESLIHVLKISKDMFSQEWKFRRQKLPSSSVLKASTVISACFSCTLQAACYSFHPKSVLGLTCHFPVTSDPEEGTLLLFATSRSCTRDKSVTLCLNWSTFRRWHFGGESLVVGFPCGRNLLSDSNFINFRFEGYFFWTLFSL